MDSLLKRTICWYLIFAGVSKNRIFQNLQSIQLFTECLKDIFNHYFTKVRSQPFQIQDFSELKLFVQIQFILLYIICVLI